MDASKGFQDKIRRVSGTAQIAFGKKLYLAWSPGLQQGIPFATFSRTIQVVVRRTFFSFFLIPGILLGLQNFESVENGLIFDLVFTSTHLAPI